MVRLLVCALVLAGCGDDLGRGLPDAWHLHAEGVTVDVERSPLRFTVRDASGRAVLTSLADGRGDGYAAMALSDGDVEYRQFVTPGYTQFEAYLDPWRDRHEVLDAEWTPARLVLALEDDIEITFVVRRSALRVTAIGGAPRAWGTAFTTPADEGFLGFGERFNRTDQRGVDVFSWAEEGGIGDGEGTTEGPENPFPHGEAMTYYPVPFFLSTEGYGFWLDTTWRSEFNLATERDDAWRVWQLGPEMAFEVYVPFEEDARPWPYHVIDAFTAATGRPFAPPSWAFGPRRRTGPGDTAMDMPELEAMRELDLAITAADDSVHFYPSGSHIGREDDLAAWIDSAAALGVRVNGYYNSMIDQDPESPIAPWAEEGAEAGHYLRSTDGGYPPVWILTGGDTPSLYVVDFTSAAATEWYQDSFDWALSLGYAGWMYDFGEYVMAESVASNGMTWEELHNLYPVLYARAAHERLEAGPYAGDWLAFMRSGYTGSSAFAPMVWAGDPAASFEDPDGLPSMVPAGINIGISGAPFWGGDIGGFHCTADGAEAADEELLVRWIQHGALTPNMQDQNACVGGADKASIWTAPAALEAWRTYARLHTRLFPYLDGLARVASATGAPIVRHLYLEHPDRPDLRGVDDAYYFGPALLVAPVVERGARARSVHLPAATYLDWNRRSVVEGGGEVEVEAPLDELPLFLRAGHLIPMLDATIDTLADEDAADVVGPADVADVYDAVGLLAPGAESAQVSVDGDAQLTATMDGAPAAPDGLSVAASEEELASCDGCYLLEELPGGLVRLRVSATAADVTAGDVRLTSTSDRRVRWDLYVVAP